MIPDALQYSSNKTIVTKLRGLNPDIILVIEITNDILDEGGDVTLRETLVKALGAANGTII
jgi:hypothetical protein